MRTLTKSELIDRIFARLPNLTSREAEFAVNEVLRTTVSALSRGVRVEIRGFGSFPSSIVKHARDATRVPVRPFRFLPSTCRISARARKFVMP